MDLQQKIGPAPVWVWGAAVVAICVIAYVAWPKKASPPAGKRADMQSAPIVYVEHAPSVVPA